MQVLVIGTRDTKAAELDYVAGLIGAAGCDVVLVDVGTLSDGAGAHVTPAGLAGVVTILESRSSDPSWCFGIATPILGIR
jgi:uncharacterized protein (UPF0261 family)